MTAYEVLLLTAKLISIRSLSGEEHEVAETLKELFASYGWATEMIPVENERSNLLVTFGSPQIVFTTHIDVVPAPPELFVPRFEGSALYGRGACDAKGIVATMIGAARALQKRGCTNFGLLFVVGEETDGQGAKIAAEKLAGRGIRYLVNGEPTEGKLVIAHKGDLVFELKVTGRSCHSGYPELGVDANAGLIAALGSLLQADLGEDPILGRATLNVGTFKGGVASNVVSPSAEALCHVRVVTSAEDVLERIRIIIGPECSLTVLGQMDPSRMKSVPGFETSSAAYSTDIPHFLSLGAQALLYGPGSIHCAHTDFEHISAEAITEALEGYVRLYEHLSGVEGQDDRLFNGAAPL